jgi:hypothetical protein
MGACPPSLTVRESGAPLRYPPDCQGRTPPDCQAPDCQAQIRCTRRRKVMVRLHLSINFGLGSGCPKRPQLWPRYKDCGSIFRNCGHYCSWQVQAQHVRTFLKGHGVIPRKFCYVLVSRFTFHGTRALIKDRNHLIPVRHFLAVLMQYLQGKQLHGKIIGQNKRMCLGPGPGRPWLP